MSEPEPDGDHVKPYVHEDAHSRTLHFSIHEVQSQMWLQAPDALALPYTRVMMGFLLFHPSPERMAMVGLGGGSIAKFCHAHLPGTRLDVVEVNPHVIALREAFCIPPDGERFQVIRADGAEFVQRVTVPYDVILLDGYDDQGLPAALSSQVFYDGCARALRPGGVLVANFPAGLRGAKACIQRIRRALKSVVLQVSDEDMANVVVMAFKPDPEAPLPGRMGVLTRPVGLSEPAWTSLLSACARLAEVWNARPH